MQTIIDSFLDQVASLLGPLSPFTKAVVPAAASLVAVITNSLIAGSFNATSVAISVTGLVGALLTYFLPNKSKS